MINTIMRTKFVQIIIFIYFVFFILIQISARYYSYCNTDALAQYGFPLPFINAKGWELNLRNGFDYQDSPLSTKIFDPVKPYYWGSGRVVNPKRTGYFLWQHDNYKRVPYWITTDRSHLCCISDRIREGLVFHLPVAQTVNKEFDPEFNAWVFERIIVPWRSVLFNVIYFIISCIGVIMFIMLFSDKRRIAAWIIFGSLIVISAISILISVNNILFSEYYDLSTGWFYNLLFLVNVCFFVISGTGIVTKFIQQGISYCRGTTGVESDFP